MSRMLSALACATGLMLLIDFATGGRSDVTLMTLVWVGAFFGALYLQERLL